MLYIVHCRTSFSVWVMFSRMLSFKASMVRDFSPVHSLLQVAPKKKNHEMSSLEIEGATGSVIWFRLAVQYRPARWKREPLSAICWGCGQLLRHSTGMNSALPEASSIRFRSFVQELQAKTSRAFCMNYSLAWEQLPSYSYVWLLLTHKVQNMYRWGDRF
jgi:hypothetical protein